MAAILGVSVQHLGRLAKSGDLPAPLERDRWDVAATVQAFVRYAQGAAKPGDGSDAKSEELLLLRERRRKTAADAAAQERENARALGALIEAEFARQVFFEFARRDRDAWTNWAAATAPLLAADLAVAVEPVIEALSGYVHDHISRLGDVACAIDEPMAAAACHELGAGMGTAATD